MVIITCIMLIFAFYCLYSVYVSDRQKSMSEKQQDALSEYESMLSPIGVNTITREELIGIDKRAKKKVFSLLSKLNLLESEVYDTHSSFGFCAYKNNHLILSLEAKTAKPHYTANIELISFFKAYNPDRNKKAIRLLFDYQNSESSTDVSNFDIAVNEYTDHLRKMVEIIKEPIRITSARIINSEHIAYYKVEGVVQYVSDVKGRGANLAGAVYGGIVAGGAGAVVGSQLGTEINTDIVRKDDRRLFFYYTKDGVLKNEEIITDNVDYILSLLREWMPEKEYSYVVANNNSKPTMREFEALPHNDKPKIEEQTAPVKHSYAELKELKELLDLGIITQEEFERKKKEILG